MPIYEYACHDCGERTSTFVRSWAAPESVTCEHCGSTDTARTITAPVVHMGPLSETKGKPSEEAQQAAKDKAMRDVADVAINQTLKKMGKL